MANHHLLFAQMNKEEQIPISYPNVILSPDSYCEWCSIEQYSLSLIFVRLSYKGPKPPEDPLRIYIIAHAEHLCSIDRTYGGALF